MSNGRPEVEMYAVLDSRVSLLRELRECNPGARRRQAQWPTWQQDRSWPERVAARAIPRPKDRKGLRAWDRLTLALWGVGALASVFVMTVVVLLSHGAG